MKRLLIYLSLVISLLLFNIHNTHASVKVISDTEIIVKQKNLNYGSARDIGKNFCLKTQRKIKEFIHKRTWTGHKFTIICEKNKTTNISNTEGFFCIFKNNGIVFGQKSQNRKSCTDIIIEQKDFRYSEINKIWKINSSSWGNQSDKSFKPFQIHNRKLLNKIFETQIAEQEPSTTPSDNNLEEEKRKIAEEKRKIEEEKRKIAEAKKKQEEEEKQRKEANAKLYIIGSGTGFFVSEEGHIVSNDHVVGICRKVASKIDGVIKYFNVIKTDEVNDLGIVKGEYKNPTYLSIKTDGAEYGEDIVAFGYPLADALSTSVKLTRGIVSSLSGPGNNYSEIQIDAAIQPGNSGGPVLNMEGQVVGVASSGLNKLYMLEQSEYIPENVNFAVAAPTLSNFLKANGVKVDTKKFEVNNTKELARIGRPATLQLFCMNTQAVFEELKKTKKHSDVLFEKVIDLR